MSNNVKGRAKEHYMVSDIRTNSTSDIITSKTSDRMSMTLILTTIGLIVWFIFIHGTLMNILKIMGFVPRILLFLIFMGIVYMFSIETFVYQRKKKDRQTREIMARGGDMISHFMKIKETKRRNFGLPFDITVIEASNTQIVPLEITFTSHEYYSRLIDSIIKNGISYHDYQLKGKISLFDKFRSYYPKFKGEELIKILESIYRENERVHKVSPSRRTYLQLYIGYSQDIEEIISSLLRVSRCKIQFLDEMMYKEMVERYFGAPVNLERMKSNNMIRNISLEDTTFLEGFKSEEELLEFFKVYKPNYVRPSTKYKLRGGMNRNGRK